MSTESAQVMRVLDRYLDAAGLGSDPGPGVAAAAARAKDDPDVHAALSQLLAEECPATSRESWRCGLALLRARESSDDLPVAGCDAASSFTRLIVRCEAASRAAGEQDPSTAAALAEALLAVVAVERSSLGTGRSRRLRNQAVHDGVAAVRTRWLRESRQQPEGRSQSGPELSETS